MSLAEAADARPVAASILRKAVAASSVPLSDAELSSLAQQAGFEPGSIDLKTLALTKVVEAIPEPIKAVAELGEDLAGGMGQLGSNIKL